MRFESIPYLEWAKSSYQPELSLSHSYIPHRSLAELRALGVDLDALQAWPEPDSGARWGALKALVAERHGLPTEQVLLCSSCTVANFLALAAVLDGRPEGRRGVLVESPTYGPLLQQARAAGGRVRSVLTWDGRRGRPEALRQAIDETTAVVVITNPNNPTGLATPPEALAEICDAAANVDAVVLVDEVYRDFLSDELAAPAVHVAPNAISTESLSKAYGLAQLKVGWLLGPPELVARAQQVYDHIGVSIPFLNQDLARLILEGHWDTLIADARSRAAAGAALVAEWARGRDDVTWSPPDGGVIGVLEPTRCDPSTLARHLLERYQTSIVPGRFFGLSKALRLGFAAHDLEAGLANLSKALDDLKPGSRGG